MYKIVEKAGTGDCKEVIKKIQNEDNAPSHTVILVKELVVEIEDSVLNQMESIEEKNKFHLRTLRFAEKHIARNLKHTTSTMNLTHPKRLIVERKPKMMDLAKHSTNLGTKELITDIDLESSALCTLAKKKGASIQPFEIFTPPSDGQLKDINLITTSEPKLVNRSFKKTCLVAHSSSSMTTTKKPKWNFISRIIRFFHRKNT